MTEQKMTWEEMVKVYPDRWVVVKNAVMDGPDIVSGTLVEVKKDDDIIEYRAHHPRKGLVFRRTTEEAVSGIIN